MMTKEQYIESLRKLHLNLYMFGKKIENPVDDPVIRPSLNSFAATYELAEDPQYEDLMTATSHISGKKINRFTHMHQSTDDLIKKVKMQHLLGQKTAACFQRCVGMDAMNAVFSSTYEIDEACGHSGSSGSGTRLANITARHTGNGRRAHHRCKVEICP